MPVTPTNIYMSWTNVSWTNGTLTVTLTEVKSIKVAKGGETKRWFADGAPHPKAIAHRNRTRMITVKLGAINLAQQIPPDSPGTFTATQLDFRNGVGTGALVLTLNNAMLMDSPWDGENSEYATGDLALEGYMPDGSDPLTITQTV